MMSSAIRSVLVSLLLAYLPQPAFANQSRPSSAQKFDEFGDVNYSDLKARLDNFAVMLQQSPDTVGFIVVYRSRRDVPGLSHSLALRIKHYLLNSQRIEPTRVALVDGGVADHLVQELWIVPKGSAPQPRDDARIGYFQSPDTAWEFLSYAFLPPELFQRFGVDPKIDADAEYLEAFASEVSKNPTRIACIIAYAQYNPKRNLVDWIGDYDPKPDVRLDPPGVARKRLSLEKERLMKTYGIPSYRIRTIDGGYRKQREVELWIVPNGEPLPIPTPNSFPGRATKRR